MVKKSKKLLSYFNGSCDPMKEGNQGIWFDEEDPSSENYKPECCTDMYLDLANGKFEKMFQDFNIKSSVSNHFFEDDTDYQWDQENALYDEVYDFDGNEFVEDDTGYQCDQENALYDEVYDFDGNEFVEIDLK